MVQKIINEKEDTPLKTVEIKTLRELI